MHKRAQDLIGELRLQPHPEGGYFREVFRSAHKVQPLDERSARSALTTIYFLLTKGRTGAGTGSHPMRPGTSTKAIRWNSTGLIARMSSTKRCSEQALQMFIRCAWYPPVAGKRRGLSENIASSDAMLPPDSSFKISRCSPRDQQRLHTSRRCVLSLPNSSNPK